MTQPQRYGNIREFLDNLPRQPCIWQPENQNICVTCLRINEPVARVCSVWSQALDDAPLEELDFEEEMRSLPAVEKVAESPATPGLVEIDVVGDWDMEPATVTPVATEPAVVKPAAEQSIAVVDIDTVPPTEPAAAEEPAAEEADSADAGQGQQYAALAAEVEVRHVKTGKMEKGAPRTASRITTALLLLLPLLFALPSASASETELWDSGELEQGANWTHTFSMATNDMFYCKPHSPDQFPDFTGWVNVSDEAGASADDVTIYINDFSYDLRAVLIKPGTSVTWANNDSAVHTATKMDMGGHEEEEEDSPGFAAGATFVALATALIMTRLRQRGRRR